MMSKKFSTKARRIPVVSAAPQKYTTECRGCGQTVDLVTLAEASEIADTTVDEIINQAAAGRVHLAVRPEAVLICLNSLLVVNFEPLKPLEYRPVKRFARKISC